MQKQDLKNGISFKIRNGNKYYIMQDDIFVKTTSRRFECTTSLQDFLKTFDKNLKSEINEKYDVVEIFDINGNIIKERKDINYDELSFCKYKNLMKIRIENETEVKLEYLEDKDKFEIIDINKTSDETRCRYGFFCKSGEEIYDKKSETRDSIYIDKEPFKNGDVEGIKIKGRNKFYEISVKKTYISIHEID